MTTDAILIGGPRDGVLATSNGGSVIELEIGGFIHRYVVTTRRREDNDGS